VFGKKLIIVICFLHFYVKTSLIILKIIKIKKKIKKKKPLSNAIKHVQNLHSLETDADL
jgi:hypothetical protein